MSDNVVKFPGITKLDLDPDEILKETMGKLDGVIIMGYTKDGADGYFASSYSDSGEIIWLIERFKHLLLSEYDN